MADTQIDQRRRSVRCLQLLDASHRAHARGLLRACDRLGDRARETAPDTHDAVIGGILAGGLPSPENEPEDWADYVQAQRDGLAQAIERQTA